MGENVYAFLKEVRYSISARNIAFAFKCPGFQKLHEFGVLINEKVIFVTDEGSNLKKALERDTRLNCTAHVLNTAMKKVFDQEAKKPTGSQSAEVQLLTNCNALVTFIRQSRVQAVKYDFIFRILLFDFVFSYRSYQKLSRRTSIPDGIRKSI